MSWAGSEIIVLRVSLVLFLGTEFDQIDFVTRLFTAFVNDATTSATTLAWEEIRDVVDIAFLDLVAGVGSEDVVVVEFRGHAVQVERFKVELCVWVH